MTRPIYAVGDIHGQLSMLDTALELIERDGGAESRVVFLGDYVDRGPDSKGVLERLIEGKADGRDWIFLKGNHDRMMEWFLKEPPQLDPHLIVGYHWFHERLGGADTLASYGVDRVEGRRQVELALEVREKVPESHAGFLDALPLTHRENGYFFVHAGIRPGIPLDKQQETDLLWIRQEFHNDTSDHGPLIVHGHTPVERATHYGNRVNLDSGAGYGYPLSVAVFEGDSVFELTSQGRRELTPD